MLLSLATVATGATWYFLFESEIPQAEIHIDRLWKSDNFTISIKASDQKSGIRSIRLIAVEKDMRTVLYHKENQRTGNIPPFAPLEEKATIKVDCKRPKTGSGAVQFVLEVNDFSLRNHYGGNQKTLKKTITFEMQGSSVRPLHVEHSVSPGRAGSVIYQTEAADITTGVLVNGHFNQAYPVESKEKNVFVAYYGVPYSTQSLSEFAVVVTDNATHRTIVPLTTTFISHQKKKDTINLSDAFFQRKIPEFRQHYPEMKGDMLAQYLYINNTVRQQNAAAIRAICEKTSPEQLWHGAFKRMAGSKRAGFAEYRSYLYQQKVVDHQVHLGVDIASIRHDKIKAANSGIIAYADYMGIYGKMVMIDHGQGIFSLYSHLSQIDVTPGTNVKKREIIGRTGTTGMAGGDHLHFSMLVHGVFVEPKEWWDKKFIYNHFTVPLNRLRQDASAQKKQ